MPKTHISDSEASGHSLIWFSGREDNDRRLRRASALVSCPSQSESEEQFNHEQAENQHEREILDFEIRVTAPSRPWEFVKFPPSNIVEKILGEIKKSGRGDFYRIEYEDGLEEVVSIQYFA